jgi:hypothetical protein
MSRFSLAFVAICFGAFATGCNPPTAPALTPDWSTVGFDVRDDDPNCMGWCWTSVSINTKYSDIDLLDYDHTNTVGHQAQGDVTPAGVQYLSDLINDLDAATPGGIHALKDEYGCPTDEHTDIVFFDKANNVYKTVKYGHWPSASCGQPDAPEELVVMSDALDTHFYDPLLYEESNTYVEVN